MNAKYADACARLIAEFRAQYINGADLSDAEVAHGNCQQASQALVKLFPELTIQRGYCNGGAHWWTVTPEGEIVDATAIQFGTGPYKYRVVDVTKEKIRMGRCMNCGEDIYGLEKDGPKSICSQECSREYAAYCGF